MKKLFLLLLVFVSILSNAEQLEIIVPVPPGGPVDFVARILQQELLNREKITSFVVYKPGGDGQIATKYFLNNQSNKILMVSTATILSLKLAVKDIDYDPINDFKIIGPVTTAPLVVAVKSDKDMNTISDLVNKSKHTKINCGAAGSYSALYLNNLIQNNSIQNAIVVTYKSTGQPIVDLIAGNIDCLGTIPASVMNYPELTILKDDTHKQQILFDSFTAIAIGEETTSANQIKKLLTDLSTDKDFVLVMKKRGYNISNKIDFNYSKTLDKTYQILEADLK